MSELLNKQDDKYSNRNKTLDAYKAILIILVVIRHALQYSTSDEGGLLTNLIWAIQMPGFMLVSGYFCARKVLSYKDLLKSLKKSFIRYALPFFSWFIVIDVFICGAYFRNPILGVIHLIKNVDSGLWFIWVIFALSNIFNICNFYFEKNTSVTKRMFSTIIVLTFSLGGLLCLAFLTNINFAGIKYILYYSVFFGAGWVIKKAKEHFSARFSVTCFDVLFSVSLLIFLLIIFNYDLYHCDDDIISIGLRCISGFSGNFCLFYTIKKYEYFDNCYLTMLGRYTLEIYVTHMHVNGLFRLTSGYSFWTYQGFINFTVSLLCTSFFTFVIIIVLKNNRFTNKLFYGK